jgi:hypothetical protein
VSSAAGIARALGAAGTATPPSIKEQDRVLRTPRPCPRFSYRGVFGISVFLDHLKANSRDPGKAKLSRGGGHYINYTATHEGTTVVDSNHD